jgi:O-antigen ligase
MKDEVFKTFRWQSLISVAVLTYALLFLFPIAGMLIRGWLTSIYNFLFLLGLYFLHRRTQMLSREERIYLIICAVYFSIFVLSSLVNGWGKPQTHHLGTELRFLLVVPIYLLVREYPASWRWLLLGGLPGILVIFVQSVYEVNWLGLATSWGAYSKNIIGPFAALLGFWVLHLWQERSSVYLKAVISLVFVLALIATAVSGSRGGYIGFIAMFVGWLLLHIRMRWAFAVAIVVVGLMALVYQKSPIVNDGVKRAVTSFEVYMRDPDIAHSKIVMGSTEIHMEMWRAAKYFFPDHPILGVGPGNYQATAKQYAQEGKVNPAIAEHGHPHNIFLEALYSKGIVGLISLLLLLYYPFYIMFKTRTQSHTSANLGMLHIIGISAFSLFDASPILMNNYTSILLLGIAVFFSHHLQQLQRKVSSHA